MSLSHNLRHGYGCRPSGAQTEVRGPAPVRGPFTAVGRDLQKADRPECGFPVCRQSPLDTPCWSLSPHPGNIYHLRLTRAQNRTEQTDHVTPGPHLQDGPADPTRLQPDSISVQLHLPDKDSKSDPSSVWVWNFRSLLFTLHCLEFNYFYC